MKTSCNVHPLARETSSERRMLLGSSLLEREARGEILSSAKWGAAGGTCKGVPFRQHRRWLQWLSLLRKETVSHWGYKTPAIIYSPDHILLWCVYLAAVQCQSTLPLQHIFLWQLICREGCSDLGGTSLPRFPIKGDLPRKQLPLSATVHCQHLLIQNTP